MSKIANDVDFAVGLGAIRDLLHRNGIDPSEVGQLHRIKDVRLYQGLAKLKSTDADGNEVENLEVKDMASVVLHPLWEQGPEWELAQPGPLPPVKKVKIRTGTPKSIKTCVVLPDMQIGFYHDGEGNLVSTHDEKAIDLSLAIIEDLDPDLIVMVGDNMDFPEFGKYRLSPAFVRTTQATIDYTTELMYRYRCAAPHAVIKWLAGNHEERLPNYLMDNGAAAFGLSQGKHPLLLAEESRHPVLSVPHLCHLDLSDIDYLPGYPANKLFINEHLRVIHGNKVKSNGSTAHAYLNSEKTSVIYGHIHRVEYASRRFEKWDGESLIMAATPGCLAKVNGSVPSTKGGVDLNGRPLTVVEDWAQGIAIVHYETEGDHRFWYKQIPFNGHSAFVGSELYSV